MEKRYAINERPNRRYELHRGTLKGPIIASIRADVLGVTDDEAVTRLIARADQDGMTELHHHYHGQDIVEYLQKGF